MMADLVGPEPGKDGMSDPRTLTTEVVDLSDVNLDSLLEDMESVCSPELTKGASGTPSDNPAFKNYVWCSKKSASPFQNGSTKTSSIKINKSSVRTDTDSDIDSTCGMVNIHNETRFNMCENPSDLWFGLKMSDGTPVVINSRNRNFRRPRTGQKNYRKKVHRFPRSYTGPVDYSTGYLSISKYIGIASGTSDSYTPNRPVYRSATDPSVGGLGPRNRGKGFFTRGMNGRFGMNARQERMQEYIARSST